MARTLDTLFRLLIRESGILFAGFVFGKGLSFLARLVIGRFLPTGGYGAVSIGLTLLSMATTVSLVGLNTGIGRYLPRDDAEKFKRSVLTASLSIVVPLSIAIATVLFVSAGPLARNAFHSPETTVVIQAFSVAIPFSVIAETSVGAMRGNQRSLPKVYIQNIALPVSRLGFIAVFVALGFETAGMAAAYALSYAIAGVIGCYFLLRHTPLLKRLESIPVRRELLSFSAPLMVTAAVSLVFTSLDTLMLGYFASIEDVAVYNAVYPIAILLTLVQSSVGFVFMPIISEMHSGGESEGIHRMYQLAVKWIFVLTVPLFVLVVLFPEEIIRITFGTKYTDGALALVVLAVGFFSHTVVGPNGNTLTSIGNTRTLMVDNLVVAVLNFVLNVVLIPRYSYVGAAIATTVAYISLNGLYSYQLYRLTGTHPLQKAIIYPGVGGACIAAVVYYVSTWLPVSGFILLMVAGVLFVVPYFVLVLLSGGIEQEEHEVLSTIVAQFTSGE